MHVEMDQAPGRSVEADPVLDRGVAGRHARVEALEAVRREQRLRRPRSAPRHEQVEIRVARERRAQVLVALEVAMGDAGALERPEHGEQRGERLRLPTHVFRDLRRRHGQLRTPA